jgi:penicillin amidase
MRGFPTTGGTLAVAGLDQPVVVMRDAAGIPWIEAETTHDLFLAQGYVHAQDRMWQMEVWRHIGAGRLSELFGESQIDTDKFIRMLGWRQAAQRDLNALPAGTRKILDAYSAGVNAWLDGHQDLPLPFVITGLLGAGGGLSGYKPEAWTALDTVTWQKVQAWSLGSNWDSELFRLIAKGKGLTDAQLADLFPAYSNDKPTVVPAATHGADLSAPPPADVAPAPVTSATASLGRLLAVGDNLASRCRARCPSARRVTDRRRCPATAVPTTGPATCRSMTCRRPTTRRKACSRLPTTCRRARAHSLAPSSTRATAPTESPAC